MGLKTFVFKLVSYRPLNINQIKIFVKTFGCLFRTWLTKVYLIPYHCADILTMKKQILFPIQNKGILHSFFF